MSETHFWEKIQIQISKQINSGCTIISHSGLHSDLVQEIVFINIKGAPKVDKTSKSGVIPQKFKKKLLMTFVIKLIFQW